MEQIRFGKDELFPLTAFNVDLIIFLRPLHVTYCECLNVVFSYLVLVVSMESISLFTEIFPHSDFLCNCNTAALCMCEP